MTLHGPADADAFRVKVGRYGDRWYHDPLPPCALAEASTDAWPSATTVKNAWPKFLSAWAATEAAKYAVNERAAWENLDPATAVTVIAKASDRTRDSAGNRGTLIHDALEAIGNGAPLDPMIYHEITPWLPAITALAADVRPVWLLSEAVAISRTLGVAGTLDAVWSINGENYIVDFKSRAEGKGGNAYDDEGVQLGIYASADYVIVERDGRAVRAKMPPLAGGLIITIAPEGYVLHPIDLDAARRGARVLREFWSVTTGRDIIGKPVLLRNEPGIRDERREHLIGCLKTIQEAGHLDEVRAYWPAGVPTFREQAAHSDADLDRIAEVISDVAARHALPFFSPDPKDIKAERSSSVDVLRLSIMRSAFGHDELFDRLVLRATDGKRRADEVTESDVDRVAGLLVEIDRGDVVVSVVEPA